ncbi:MAG: hypothetical protein QNL51_05835 [Opitutaceae bacterium]
MPAFGRKSIQRVHPAEIGYLLAMDPASVWSEMVVAGVADPGAVVLLRISKRQNSGVSDPGYGWLLGGRNFL